MGKPAWRWTGDWNGYIGHSRQSISGRSLLLGRYGKRQNGASTLMITTFNCIYLDWVEEEIDT